MSRPAGNSDSLVATNQSPRRLSHWMTVLGQMLHFRLARKLFLVVIATIVLIEFIIVFPSYSNYRTNKLSEYREIARVATRSALSSAQLHPAEISERLSGIIQSDP